ncbi:hypothetical protein [Hydrogenophaga sp. Root209]|uniref:hypothetical protein n=1 Tax=Hydrogenophaga sp. Root209 TaxID=1736490 RepID=UPI0012E3CC0B|nr:hypothetical protein [Hydrogenophaga sp. Root209]
MPQLPTSPHEWVLWLFENLEGVEHAGAHWEGRLPADVDFKSTVDSIPETVRGLADIHIRKVEFHPEAGDVYADMDALVKGSRLRKVPLAFTVRQLGYEHGQTSPPHSVRNYLDAVKLWQLLHSFSDYEVGQSAGFIKSYDAKVELRPDYQACDLVTLPGLSEFGEVYFVAAHHREEKRNIVRSALLETCKGQKVVRLAELLPRFGDLVDRVKASYTLYTADFSFEKLRSEVDAKNVDDMLRLNKTLADIQNQLLALPAALLIAGASVRPDSLASNVTIWLGVSVFAWVMGKLVANQRHSVSAIEQEAQLRIAKVAVQPEDISKLVLPLFKGLEDRVTRQQKTLRRIGWSVWLVWFAATAVVIHAQWPQFFPMCVAWLADLVRDGRAFPAPELSTT